MTVIVDNAADLKKALGDGNIIGHVGFTYKKAGELHDGHTECVRVAKDLSDVVYVSFNSDAFFCLLFNHQKNLAPGLFDQEYCISWCEDNNVDVVFIPSDEDVLKTFGFSSESEKEQKIKEIRDIFTLEGYRIEETGVEQFSLIFSLIDKIRYDNNLWSKHVHVTTWNDGYYRFIQKDFAKKYCGYDVHIIDPVIDISTGLPYSTKIGYLSEPQKNTLLSINKEIQTKESSDNTCSEIVSEVGSDASKYSGILFYKCVVYSGGVVGNNTLVSSTYAFTGNYLFKSGDNANQVIVNNFYIGVIKGETRY